MLETPRLVPNGRDSYRPSFGSDQNLHVEFLSKTIYLEAKSEAEGHPCYEERDFINIMVPGARSTIIEPVKMVSDQFGPSHPDRFPRQWAQYKAKKEQIGEGLPLVEWPLLTGAQALALRGIKVYTVEQLADTADNNLHILDMAIGLGARMFRDKAKAYLERSSDASSISKLFAKVEQLEADNAALKEQLQIISTQPAPSKEDSDAAKKEMMQTVKAKRG